MKTDRLLLSKLDKNHKKDIKILYQDSLVRRYLGGIKTDVEFDTIFNELLNSDISENYWSIQDLETQEIIGLVSITKYHSEDKFEVSYQLSSTYWGKGYAFEFVSRIIEFGFNDLKLAQIYAETQEKNEPSIKLLKKVGMNLQGDLIRHSEKQLVFSLCKEDYFNSKL